MKVLVFGSNGLVGSSVSRKLSSNKNIDLLSANRKSADLFSLKETKLLIHDFKPNVIVNAAAKVGGIVANNTNRTEFILENLKINSNIIESMIGFPDTKLINLGSSCIYPLNAVNPIHESSLMTGTLEPTNSPYAMAKLTAIELGDSLSKQFGNTVVNLMPTNLYGPNDNFDPVTSHVIPGLMGRLHKAKIEKENEFYVWGTGSPLREFLYVDDLANCIEFIIKENIDLQLINVGSGEEVSIKDLVENISKIVKFEGEIKFDISKPDGNPRKLLDSNLINNLGWEATTSLEEGLNITYKWFLNNFI
jgi:GDP-L-fucose synthase